MRKLLILLLLVLSAIWLYTSWYWYTCVIKGFCNATEVVMLDKEVETDVVPSGETKEPETVVEPKVEETNSEPVIEEKEPIPETTPESEPVVVVEEKKCETLIVTPIRLGSPNDVGDVKDLQDFLNAFEGESLTVDGVYDQDDFEAVKSFQTKYASEILTPWGVETPTGYVYKTTTKKINEIYCSK